MHHETASQPRDLKIGSPEISNEVSNQESSGGGSSGCGAFTACTCSSSAGQKPPHLHCNCGHHQDIGARLMSRLGLDSNADICGSCGSKHVSKHGAYYCLNIQLFPRQDVQLNAVGLAFPWNQCKRKWVQWWCVMMCNIFTSSKSNSNTTQR